MNQNVRIDNKETLLPRWFVMRAYKSEKTAERLLSGENGLPHFIPKHYVVRTYHGRKQRKLVPVIPSVVFVRACRSEIQDFRLRFNRLPLQYIMRRGRGAAGEESYLVVPDKEMEEFIKVAARYETDIAYYRPDELALDKGCRVRVHGGEFDGLEGVLMKIKGKRNRRVVVLLDGIAAVAAAEIMPDLIEVLPSKGCETRISEPVSGAAPAGGSSAASGECGMAAVPECDSGTAFDGRSLYRFF